MNDLRQNLSDVLGSAHRIVRELSGGGMSRVFLAEEVGLNRDVVVKVLSPDLVTEEFLARFEQEILQTARLQHPSIVPLLSVGTLTYPSGARGPYYIMPYIRGETLRSRLLREGVMSAGTCHRVLRDVLEGLLHAHLHGVVHRDIKPENIFVAGGHAVVTDFGIARAVAGRRDAARVTMPGMVLGTPAYMAPEQAAGDGDADLRADLYSLGVVAYELLAGRPPFAGMTTHQMLAAHAQSPPPPLGPLRPDVPPEIIHLVTKCLAKDPANRWQSADEMLRVLEGIRPSDPNVSVANGHRTGGVVASAPRKAWRWLSVISVIGALAVVGVWWWFGRPTPPSDIPATVAVLRPEGAPDLTPFVDQLQRTITHELQRSGAPVLDRLAVADFEATPDRWASARRRNIRFAVSSVVRQRGAGLEVEVTLTNALTGVVLHAASLGVPDTARAEASVGPFADSLRIWLGLRSPRAGPERASRSKAVAALIDSAEREARTRTPRGLFGGIALYQRALALAPDDAGAHARLSTVYSLLLVYLYRSPASLETAAALALAHAERSIELDPGSDEAYTSRAYLLQQVNAPVAQVRADFNRARELNPSAEPGWYSLLLLREGRKSESLAEARRGVALDPRSPGRWLALAWGAFGFRDYSLALAAADSALLLDPSLSLARGVLARARLLDGRAADCAGMETWPYLGTKAACLTATGRTAEASVMVDSLLHLYTGGPAVDSTFDSALFAQELATYFAWVGEPNAARAWIRELFHLAPAGLPYPFQRSDLFAKVLSDRKFAEEVAQLEEAAHRRVREDGQRFLKELPPMPR